MPRGNYNKYSGVVEFDVTYQSSHPSDYHTGTLDATRVTWKWECYCCSDNELQTGTSITSLTINTDNTWKVLFIGHQYYHEYVSGSVSNIISSQNRNLLIFQAELTYALQVIDIYTLCQYDYFSYEYFIAAKVPNTQQSRRCDYVNRCILSRTNFPDRIVF